MENIIDYLSPNNERNNFSFKKKFPFHKRCYEAERIKFKFPGRLPIICERANKTIPELDKRKYLVPSDLTLGQFMYVIRNRMNLPPEIGLYLFVGEQFAIPSNTSMISCVYDTHRDEDGFLYINYSGENTFG